MKTITSTEFKKHLKKYADMADTEKVLVTRGNGKSFFIIPASKEESGYNKEFVQEILASKASKEKYKISTDSASLQDLLGL